MTKILVLYNSTCPSTDQTVDRIKSILVSEGVDAEIEMRLVETDEEAEEFEFGGSPTIRVGASEVQPLAAPPGGGYHHDACRTYLKPDGQVSPVPPEESIREVLRRERVI